MSSSVAAKVTSVQPEPKSVDPGGRSRQHVSSTVSVPGRYTWNEAVNRRNKHNRHNGAAGAAGAAGATGAIFATGNKENDKVRCAQNKSSVWRPVRQCEGGQWARLRSGVRSGCNI